MSELEIHVLSTPRSSVDSVEVSVSGVGGSQLCKKLIIDVCSGSGVPSAHHIPPGAMQKDETRRRMEVALEDVEKDIDEVLDEELEAIMEGGVSTVTSSSRPETPQMCTSPPMPIPPCMSPLLWHNFVGTPTRSASFNRFHTPEATSPLSSGYGSIPRFFPIGTTTASTQTPPLSPLETIRVSVFSSFPSPDTSPGQRVRLRRQRLTEESRRTRFYSEGSAEPAPNPAANAGDGDDDAFAEPLPDVVAFRRDRANSAPARPLAPEIAAGRELRRIGDEFVSLFEEQQRTLRRSGPTRRSFVRRFLDSLSEMTQPDTTTPSANSGKPNSAMRPAREGSSV